MSISPSGLPTDGAQFNLASLPRLQRSPVDHRVTDGLSDDSRHAHLHKIESLVVDNVNALDDSGAAAAGRAWSELSLANDATTSAVQWARSNHGRSTPLAAASSELTSAVSLAQRITLGEITGPEADGAAQFVSLHARRAYDLLQTAMRHI